MGMMQRRFSPTVVDLFCGAGGISEGFRRAGFDALLGADSDPNAVRTYQRHHGNGMQCRIEDLTADRIRRLTGGRQITVLTAGPPCQAFSTVAIAKLRSLKRSTTVRNPMNMLYRHFLRLVKSLDPPFFVMENVGRMFSIGGGTIKDDIVDELGKYRITFYRLNTADFGVPQNRKRGVVIGNRLGLDNPTMSPTHCDPEAAVLCCMQPHETVKSAISDLPFLRAGAGAEFARYTKFANLTDYQMARRRGSGGVHNHVSRQHSERDLKIFNRLSPGQNLADLPEACNPYRKDIFKDKIRKQAWDSPSSTILSHLSKDGLMFVHPDGRQNRSLTPREAARLQSFDDSYVFEGPRTSQYVQIGNAVPPLFAMRIAASIMEKLKIAPPVSGQAAGRQQ